MYHHIIIILSIFSISSWAMNIPQAAVNHANSAHSSANYSGPNKKYTCVYQGLQGESEIVVSSIYKNKDKGHYLNLTDDEKFTINREESNIYASVVGDISCNGVKGIEIDGYWYFEVINGPITLYKDLPEKGKAVMFKKDDIQYKKFDSNFESALSDNEEALNLYKGLKNKKKLGNVLMWSGLGLTIVGVIMSFGEESSSGEFGEEKSPSFNPSPLIFIGAG